MVKMILNSPPVPKKPSHKVATRQIDTKALHQIEQEAPKEVYNNPEQIIWVKKREYFMNTGRLPERVVVHPRVADNIYDRLMRMEGPSVDGIFRIYSLIIIEAINIKEDEIYVF